MINLEPDIELALHAIQNFLSKQQISDFALNCTTREEAETFLIALHYTGRDWSETKLILTPEGNKNIYWKYKSNTCYRFFLDKKEVLSAQKSFYEKKDLRIISYQELLKFASEEEQKQYETAKQPKQTQEKSNTVVSEENTSETYTEKQVDENPSKENISTQSVKNEEDKQSEKVITPKEPIKAVKTADLNKMKVIPEEETKSENEPCIEDFGGVNRLSSLLGVTINQPFSVFSRDSYIFSEKDIYRITENGFREKLIDQKHNLWIQCNDEIQLAYLIAHPENIIL